MNIWLYLRDLETCPCLFFSKKKKKEKVKKKLAPQNGKKQLPVEKTFLPRVPGNAVNKFT